MHKTLTISCVMLLVCVGCGGEDPQPEASTVKKLGGESPKETPKENDTTEPVKTTTPSSIKESKDLHKLNAFRKRLMDAKNSDARTEALGDIARFGTPGKPLMTEVVACFKDKDYMVRSESLLAAAAINPAGCKDFLMSGLKDSEAEVRMASVQAWVDAPLKDLEPLFMHLENEVEAGVQHAITIAVREHGQEFHVDRAVKLIDEVSPGAAKPLIDFMIAKKAVKHVGVLVDCMNQSDESVRVAAAKGLGELGVKTGAVLGALVEGLEDDDSRVRLASFSSLKELTKQDLGYKVDAPEATREKSVSAWKEWVKKNG